MRHIILLLAAHFIPVTAQGAHRPKVEVRDDGRSHGSRALPASRQ